MFALAVANRSLALAKLGRAAAALADTELALATGYPGHSRAKLLERRERQSRALASRGAAASCGGEGEGDTVNPAVPAFRDSVRICYSEDRGRYGVATRDLQPGETVLTERPVAAALKPEHAAHYCDACWARVPAAERVPCPRCCAVVYCSAACGRVSRARGHALECGRDIAARWQLVAAAVCGEQATISPTHHLLCYRVITGQPLHYWLEHGAALLAGDARRGAGEGKQFLSQDHASLFSLLSHAAATAARVRGEQLVSAWVQLRQLEQAGYLQLRDTGAAQLLARLVLRTLGTMR